jgi:hypothetical protein
MDSFIMQRSYRTDHHLVAAIVVFLRFLDNLAEIFNFCIVIRILNKLLQILQRFLAVSSAVTAFFEEIITAGG